jgi:hypothetical protein
VLIFIVSLAGLAATALLVAASFRLSFVATMLAAYLVASAEVVALAEMLSPAHAIRRGPYLAATCLLLGLAAWSWNRVGRPRPGLPAMHVRALVRHPIVGALLIAVVAAIGFETFLVLHTVPNNYDSMTYHLSRAAAWFQQHSLGYVPAHTERQNADPGNAELQILYTFVFLARDTAAALPQLLAELVSLVAVFGIARRSGFDRAAAAFAAGIVATLSEVALQATTTQNDLITAALVASAAYFILGRRRAELAFAGLAVGLALGTKLTAVFALPLLALLAIAVLSPRRLAALAAATAVAFTLFGSVFFVLNEVHTHRLAGDPSATQRFQPKQTVSGTVSTVARTFYRFADLSGWNADIRIRVTIQNSGIAAFDALHIPAEPLESTTTPFYFLPNVRANEDYSYFGPLGALLLLPIGFGFAGAWLLRRTSRVRGLLGLALPLYALEIALAYRYNAWIGRFMLIPVVLAAPLVARAYAFRVVSAGFAAAGIAFLALTFLHNDKKPVGRDGTPTVWRLSRADAQAVSEPLMGPTLRLVDRAIPQDASVGYVLGDDEWDYPLYGSHLSRRLVKLPADAPLHAARRLGLRWVVVGEGRILDGSRREGWIGVRMPMSGWYLLAPVGSANAARIAAAVAGLSRRPAEAARTRISS